MKIAYFHGTSVPSQAASTVQVMKMCEAFAELGHEVLLLVPRASVGEKDAGDIYRHYGVTEIFKLFHHSWFLGGKRWLGLPVRGFFSALQLALKIRQFGADLVYSRFALAGLIAATTGLRVVHELHRPLSHLSKREANITRRLLNHPRMVRAVTISAALKRQYLLDVPKLTNKVVVAHDGANIGADFSEVHLANRAFRVGYVGSLFPGRGIELIIALARECEFAQIHIVGGSLEEINRYKQELSYVHNVYMHGYQPNPIAMKMLKDFDVVLAPYGSKVSVYGDAEADTSAFLSPLKLFEYMAAGKAIICSDLEVLQEVITHEETALICERENVAAWVMALRRLWQDPSLRLALGQRARNVCKSKYSWRARAEYVINFKSGD